MLMRTEYCGLITDFFLNKVINLCGWVHKYRNHGKIIFVDLRDKEGIIQIIFNTNNIEVFKLAQTIRNEFCVSVKGIVLKRSKNNINYNIKTGFIEVLAYNLIVLNESIELPFSLEEENLSETIRLKYRVLDLRRQQMQKNIIFRSKVILEIRKFLNKKGFIEIETPFLTKSTPEGARDYLVPSRIYKGSFFSLPQSPQIFKQLLMVSSFDRYFQITKCFRDEDLRSDRQPEFTQVDCEISFLNEREIRNLFELMIKKIFKKILNIKLFKPFPIIDYSKSILEYGTDKPDIRIKLKLIELTDIINFKKYSCFLNFKYNKNTRIVCLKIPFGIKISNFEIQKYINFCKEKKLDNIVIFHIKNGKIYIKYSFLFKLIDSFFLKKVALYIQIQKKDLIFLAISDKKIIYSVLGLLRLKIGYSKFSIKYNIFKNILNPIWVINFPMFKYNKDLKQWSSFHHPFTCPKKKYENFILNTSTVILTKSYDMILNGCEIAGGSIRIHKSNIQRNVFKRLMISDQDIETKFGFLLKALEFGAPPHGGIAFGLDRLIAIMINANSIRDVIAFPKTSNCQCLLTDAPSKVEKEQLDDLDILIREK